MQTVTITKTAALLLGMGFIASMILVAVGTAWAGHQFSDVPDDHIFHDSIGYVAGVGITNGFPDGTYRPSDPVTRGQMAAFFHRASGNDERVAPSVNAAKLGGVPAEEILSDIAAVKAKLAPVSYDPTTKVLLVSGANLQVVNGSGSTWGTLNGLGNLIVGYNEGSSSRTGIHNLVVGPNHSYSSFGGLVAGAEHTASGPYAAVMGFRNTASGQVSTVTGGFLNTASGDYSTVSGGWERSVSGEYDWRAGGLSQDY